MAEPMFRSDEIRREVDAANDRREFNERWRDDTPLIRETDTFPKPEPLPAVPIDPFSRTYFVNYYPDNKHLMGELHLNAPAARFCSGDDAEQIEVRLVRVTET